MIARTALGVIVALAQATELTGTLTLACQGTTTDTATEGSKPEPPI